MNNTIDINAALIGVYFSNSTGGISIIGAHIGLFRSNDSIATGGKFIIYSTQPTAAVQTRQTTMINVSPQVTIMKPYSSRSLITIHINSIRWHDHILNMPI